MRIEKNLPSSIKDKRSERTEGNNPSEQIKIDFKEKLSEINQQEIKERLDKLMKIIDEHGERLKKTLDEKNLIEYKKRVKDFLKTIQGEFAHAKQSFSWDGRGNMRTYTIIEKIDNKLDSLHQMFMEEQADSLEILNKIGEIRGLLLDLYV